MFWQLYDDVNLSLKLNVTMKIFNKANIVTNAEQTNIDQLVWIVSLFHSCYFDVFFAMIKYIVKGYQIVIPGTS